MLLQSLHIFFSPAAREQTITSRFCFTLFLSVFLLQPPLLLPLSLLLSVSLKNHASNSHSRTLLCLTNKHVPLFSRCFQIILQHLFSAFHIQCSVYILICICFNVSSLQKESKPEEYNIVYIHLRSCAQLQKRVR